MRWSAEASIEVQARDLEGLALRLSRLPTEVQAPVEYKSKTSVPVDAAGRPLLFLRPITWPLECQSRVLEATENLPPPRLAPVIRLVSTQPLAKFALRLASGGDRVGSGSARVSPDQR